MTTLFTSATPENPPNPDGSQGTHQASTSGFDTLLSAIKNERGEQKYRNVEEALKALNHSQSYIPEVRNELNQTKQELLALQERLKETEEMKKIVDELATRQKQKQEPPDQVFDESKIAELVDRRLTATELETKVRTNQTSVRDSLVSTYGEKAADVFNSKAAEFGMSPEEFTSLAGRSPKAVLSMLGVSGDGAPKQPKHSPPQGSIRTDGFQGKPSSLLGDRSAFVLRPGATNRDVEEMANRADDLRKELEREGVSIHDLTNPAIYNRYFGN